MSGHHPSFPCPVTPGIPPTPALPPRPLFAVNMLARVDKQPLLKQDCCVC